VLVDDFDFDLPQDRVAQRPARRRDTSRLMVLNRSPFSLSHHTFRDLPELLRSDDLLVLNDSRVLPARVRARKQDTGGDFELLLTEETAGQEWWALLRPGKRARIGTRLEVLDRRGATAGITATVLEKTLSGICRLRFEGHTPLTSALDRIGQIPLPPYIVRDASGPTSEDRRRYQTIYARSAGSIAAPTAGLHFTHSLLNRVRARGVEICHLTLHVGLGTFNPVRARLVEEHTLHAERYELNAQAAVAIRAARATGRRVVAVGTTSVRVLEHVAGECDGEVQARTGQSRLFIHPPRSFRVVDALITNFHLPRSSLLMLVAAFTSPGRLEGRQLLLRAYREAVQQSYRFHSYGDAMFIQ
jgi:S-adenosylmethionine:tRNA ribosyltransferase-isomerase